MKVIMTGATGMVGKGVLFEAFNDPRITEIVAVNRSPLDFKHPKLREIIHQDFFNFEAFADEFKDAGAVLFCIGVSAVGMSEEKYSRLTYDLTMAFADVAKKANPNIRFIYITGQGTDANGRAMWKQVKGRTENALLEMFDEAYMLRPGYIQPQNGIKSKIAWYNWFYAVLSWPYPIFKFLAPTIFLSTKEVGKAYLELAIKGSETRIFETKDIYHLVEK